MSYTQKDFYSVQDVSLWKGEVRESQRTANGERHSGLLGSAGPTPALLRGKGRRHQL